jgi:hypothetical protein
MSDDKPIKLVRKRLDDAGVVDHLEQLAGDAQAIEIRTKDAKLGYSEASAGDLAELGRQLITGAIAAVQIRFHQNGDWWCDTVMRADKDFRLVRMRQGE